MAEVIVGMSALERRLTALASAGTVGRPLMNALAAMTIREAKYLAPQRTRHLIATIDKRNVTDTSAQVIAGASYAGFVEGGTGLFGPRHQRITPQAAKALRWMGGPAGSLRLTGSRRSGKAGAGAGYIFAKSTKGMKPHPFLLPGARSAIAKGGLLDNVVSAWNTAA